MLLYVPSNDTVIFFEKGQIQQLINKKNSASI